MVKKVIVGLTCNNQTIPNLALAYKILHFKNKMGLPTVLHEEIAQYLILNFDASLIIKGQKKVIVGLTCSKRITRNLGLASKVFHLKYKEMLPTVLQDEIARYLTTHNFDTLLVVKEQDEEAMEQIAQYLRKEGVSHIVLIAPFGFGFRHRCKKFFEKKGFHVQTPYVSDSVARRTDG